jgi:hypothetical protein
MAIFIPVLFLVGAVLGMRFKVLILIPAIGFAVGVVLAAGIAGGASLAAILAATALASICLQFGYLGGIGTRYSMALIRTARSQQRFAPRPIDRLNRT